MEFPECTEENKNPKITISDKKAKNNKSKVILENPDRKALKIIQIEDCVIPQGTKGGRCDKLIVVIPDNHLIFIELKGSKVKTAIKQLIDSINYIQQQCSSINSYTIDCIISCTKCPSFDTGTQKYKDTFKKKYKAKLIIKTGVITHPI